MFDNKPIKRYIMVVAMLAFPANVSNAQESSELADLGKRACREASEMVQSWPVVSNDVDSLTSIVNLYSRTIEKALYCGLAKSMPLEWFVHSEIVFPLIDSDLIPSSARDLGDFDTLSGSAFVTITYGRKHDPSLVDHDAGQFLRQFKCSRTIFGRNQLEIGKHLTLDNPQVAFLRVVDRRQESSTATVVASCRIVQKKSGRVFSLVAFEEYGFHSRADAGTGHWRLNESDYALTFIDQKSLPAESLEDGRGAAKGD